jgi:predicted enzyme related to lactoylglutathione lyase
MSERVPGLHGVVYVADLERCATFYAEVAGLQVVERDDGFVTLASDAVELSLVRMPYDEPVSHVDNSGGSLPERRSENPVKLSFPVDSLEATAGRAETLGGALDDADSTWEFRGWRHRHGVDPEGNVVSFREPSTRA